MPPDLSLSPAKEHMLLTLWGKEPTRDMQRVRDLFPQIELTWFGVGATDNFVDTLALGERVPNELWAKATILVTLFALPKSADLVPNLKYIHLFSAGIDHFSTHPLLHPPTSITSPPPRLIPMSTSTGIAAPPIAEYITMTLLSLTNRLPLQLDWQRNHTWGGKTPFLTSMGDWVGKTVGIAGYGSIGRHTGRIMTALGATVHAYTATPRDTPDQRRDRNYVVPGTGDPDGTLPARWFSGTQTEDLHRFLASGLHALIVCLPLTAQTKGLLGTPEFELLQRTSPFPPSDAFDAPLGESEGGGDDDDDDVGASRPAGAFVVNVARGQILDQDALIDALKRRVVRAAALDVTHPEPLPESSELWDLAHCIVTPHTSALGSEYGGRCFDVLLENLKRMERGDQLLNLVRLDKGY